MAYRRDMPPESVRLTFAGWQLGEYGGMETRVAAAAALAADAGMSTRVVTGRPIVDGSPVAALLDRTDRRSALDRWTSSPHMRAYRAAATVAASARSRRRLTRAESARIGHRSAQRATDRFWGQEGVGLLRRTDVLHLFGPPHPFLVAGLEAAHALEVPTVYQSVHAVTEEYAQNRWRKGFIDRCNLLDLLLVSHPSQADGFREHFHYGGEVEFISQWAYGVEPELLELTDRIRSDHHDVVVGALCRIDEVKGLDDLVDAFVAALRRQPRLRLRIGGTGPWEHDLQRHIEGCGASERIELTGFVHDRVTFYRDIDVFVISSRGEGGPVTGVEAMAAGLPIVSTKVGAMPDRLHDGGGVLIEVGDSAALAEALTRVATDATERRRLGALARSRYLAEYSEARQSARLLDVWQRLAAAVDRPSERADPAKRSTS